MTRVVLGEMAIRICHREGGRATGVKTLRGMIEFGETTLFGAAYLPGICHVKINEQVTTTLNHLVRKTPAFAVAV